MKTEILVIVMFSFFYCNLALAQKQNSSLSEFISAEDFKNLPEEVQLDLKKNGYDDNSYGQAGMQKNALVNTRNPNPFPLSKPYKKRIKGQPDSFALVKSLNQENSSYYTEKLDSIVDYEVIPVPEYDSLEVQNTIEKFDENGFLTEMITQSYDSTSNKLVNLKKDENNYDSEGNLLQKLTYEWNGEIWAVSGKNENEYNLNRRITSSSTYSWNGNDWDNVTKTEYEYDTQGEQTANTYYRVDYNNEWVIYNKIEVSYHENGERANTSIYSLWNPEDSAWTTETRAAYEETGRIIFSETKKFNPAARKMEPSYKTEYEYLEDESIIETRFRWNAVAQEFYQEYQIRYKYERIYENNNLIQEIRLNYVYGNWEYQYKKINEYDQWGNQVLTEFYDPYWGNDGEIQRRTIRAFNETGKLIRFEDYSWEFDEEYYYKKKVGILFYEFELDNDGKNLSYTRYKWDKEKEDWLVDWKDYFLYPDEGEYNIHKYQFNVTGYIPVFIKAYLTILNYNEFIGKYTGINDGMGSGSQITYNEDLKVDKVLYIENGIVYDSISCYYNREGRDSLWINFYYSPYFNDTVFNFVRFSYSMLSAGEMEITEFYYDDQSDVVFDEYGNIINGRDLYIFKSIFKDGRMLQSTRFSSGDDWNTTDSTLFTYNANGQIETVLFEDDYQKTKKEYLLTNDTLFRNEYIKRTSEQTSEWILEYKTFYKIDPAVNKNQILNIPALMFDEVSYLYSYEWHLQYDYGKILEVFGVSDYGESGNFSITSKAEVYYSKASSLQGEGYISGYIFNEDGENKIITTTTNNTGEPIKGVPLSLCAREDNFVLAGVTTSTNGFYEFKGVPEGTFYLKIDLEGFEQGSTHEMQVTSDLKNFENKNFNIQGAKVVSVAKEWKSNIKIYPNPTSGKVTILGLNPDPFNIVSVYSPSGNRVYENKTSNNSDEINMYNFAAGVYILEIVNKDKAINFKIIKN